MAGFYGSLGWGLDADRSAGDSFRIVQLTPAGSGCSIQFGAGVTSAAPGSARDIYLTRSHIEAACDELVARGHPLAGTLAGHGRPPVGGRLSGGGARRRGSPGPVHDDVDVVPPDDAGTVPGNGNAVVDAHRH